MEETYDKGSELRRVRLLSEMSLTGSPVTIERSLVAHEEQLRAGIVGDAERGPLGEALGKILRYATGLEPGLAKYARRYAAEILALSISSHLTQIDPEDVLVLENIDPYGSDLCVLCCAALGRYRLEVEKDDVPDFWFSALTSIRIQTIRAYVCRKSIRRPPNKSKRYLRHKDAVVMFEKMGKRARGRDLEGE